MTAPFSSPRAALLQPRKWLWLAAVALLCAFILGGKMMWAIGGAAGLLLFLIIVRWPVAGVVAMVFAGTSLQVFGSEYSTGLPLSLSRISGILTSAALAFLV